MVRWIVGSNLHGRPIELFLVGARCSFMVRAFAHGAMDRRISWERDVAPW